MLTITLFYLKCTDGTKIKHLAFKNHQNIELENDKFPAQLPRPFGSVIINHKAAIKHD